MAAQIEGAGAGFQPTGAGTPKTREWDLLGD